MRFVHLSPNKRFLNAPDGCPFFILGANYEGYFDRAWKMWSDNKFDPNLIALDFDKMAQTGLNAVRLFVQPALERDIRANNFSKLDRALQLAAERNLRVLLTFNDSHALNLSAAARVDAKIAARYKDDPAILAWDLENEPVFYNFAAAVYPREHPAPLQTSALVDHYGAIVSQSEAIELQRRRRIPAHLSPALAFYYINALRLFIRFNNDALTWARQQGKTLVDYIYSSDAAPWHKLIETLNGAVSAWLRARHTPVRNADPNHLITVGYNWLHFAGLPANRRLDFQEFHKYGAASLTKFRQLTAALDGLQRAFPNHPVMMGEFGYSNQSGSNPALSRPVSAKKTALFESALLAYLRANGFAGGMKWMLNDVDAPSNPYEASFGVYRLGDRAKPIKSLLAHFGRSWPAPPKNGVLRITQDRAGLAFRLDLGAETTLAGGVFQDETFSWQADDIAACFITRRDDYLQVTAQGRGHLALDPWEALPAWDAGRQSALYRLANDVPIELALFPAAERAEWTLQPGVVYRLTQGEVVPSPPAQDPDIIPNPGEHLILLGDSNAALRLSAPYIRKFAPDISFAPERAAGRWIYVTVVASPAQISDEMLQNIRSAGAHLVERIDGDVEAVLGQLIAQNRRFLAAAEAPPIEPPLEPPEPPPNAASYTVHPGDNLGKIALRFYGKASLWTLIFEANRDVLNSPGLIRPGMVLKIPPRP